MTAIRRWPLLLALVAPLCLAAELRFTLGEQQLHLTAAAPLQLEQLASLRQPRLISLGPADELLIGSRGGELYRLAPPYRQVELLATLPGYPHHALVRNGEIFVATTAAVLRGPYASDQPLDLDQLKPWLTLPGGGGHTSRTLAIDSAKRLYVALGITGNCSDQYLHPSYPFNEQRGGIALIDESGSTPQLSPFVTGMRNPVGVIWHGDTLYASNNGPDHLGFELPREILIKTKGPAFYGAPWFYHLHGTNGSWQVVPDGCISSRPPQPLSEVALPFASVDARNAPMAVAVASSSALPGVAAGELVMALRGSWATAKQWDNSSRRPPKLVKVDSNGIVSDLLTGFQAADGSRWARPVGLLFAPDGSLLFTVDEGAEGLYRLSAATQQSPPATAP